MPTRTAMAYPGPRPVPSTLELMRAAREGFAEASRASTPASRYAAAHLAALRAAAAVLAARARPDMRTRRKPRNVWALLPQAAPSLREWAVFFAAGARKRAAADAGLERAVSRRDADDLLRDVETFLALVETTLDLRRSDAATAGASVHEAGRPPAPVS